MSDRSADSPLEGIYLEPINPDAKRAVYGVNGRDGGDLSPIFRPGSPRAPQIDGARLRDLSGGGRGGPLKRE